MPLQDIARRGKPKGDTRRVLEGSALTVCAFRVHEGLQRQGLLGEVRLSVRTGVDAENCWHDFFPSTRGTRLLWRFTQEAMVETPPGDSPTDAGARPSAAVVADR